MTGKGVSRRTGPWRRLLDGWWARAHGRPFEAFQVEVTTRCNLRCVMCPRTALGGEWPELDLPWEGFVRLARAFGAVRHVHLQGWGEPLLHARLPEMVAMAKAAGCRVGITTNGMRLDAEVGQQLVALGVDVLAVSIAGATPATHAAIRVGSDLGELLDNVRRFLAIRRAGRVRGKAEFAFLMTRTNLHELPTAVELAADIGVDELYATNLDYVVGAEQEDLTAFGCPESRGIFQSYLQQAREAARRRGLSFRVYPLEPEELSVCEASPAKILFVASDGWVSPCTYAGLSGRATISRRFHGDVAIVPRVRFGSILDQEIPEIWESEEYRRFRQRFADRKFTGALCTVPGNDARRLSRPAPPDECRSCYKLYGL